MVLRRFSNVSSYNQNIKYILWFFRVITAKQNDKIYIQITKEIKSEKTEKREYDRLLDINDNYPKYLLRTDDFVGGNYLGIKTMHVADFLLSDEY